MEAIELIEVISRGEDSRTQFKREPIGTKDLAEEMVALANTHGGIIVFGVDDDLNIVGLSEDHVRIISNEVKDAANDKVRPAIYPTTEIHRIGEQGHLVMVVTVPEGVSKPYSDKSGSYWKKTSDSKYRITAREELQRMLQESMLIHADELAVAGTTTDDLDKEHLDEFFVKHHGAKIETVLERDGITISRLLNNLGLAREANLNLAGLMVFGRNPQRYRPAFVVKAVSYVGDNPAGEKYRDSEDIGGSLRDMHKKTMSFLTRNLRRVQGEKGFNTEGDLEIPVAALEELVVNMLLHRDYFISAPWRIMIFENRVEFISPGILPNNLTVENIRNGVSVIRNPIIASFATKELPYRGLGTGIRRAVAAVPDLDLESNQRDNLFTARIPRKPA